ncbi:MAG: hypothetical protein QW568_02095 [Candidatus Anstonellaceae archaeon]
MAGKIEDGRKHGITTVAVMLLGSVLLVLALAISSYVSSLSLLNRQLASIEQASVQSDAAAQGIRALLAYEGVNVTRMQGNSSANVSFRMDFQKFRNYSTDADRLASFIASAPGQNVSINTTEARWPKFTLVPQNVSADFGTTGWTRYAAGSDAGSIRGYDVLVGLGQPTPTLNWTAKSEVPQGDPDALYLHIGVQGNEGSPASYSGYLNKSNAGEVRLQDGAGKLLMIVFVVPPSGLQIYYDAGNGTAGTGLNGTVETVVMLNGRTTAVLGTSIINVNGAVKSSGHVYMDEN